MSRGFSCALVGAAPFERDHFLAERFDEVIAVDGGFSSLRDAGVLPGAAIGDFDSLGFVPQNLETEVHPTMKDESDLALALSWAQRRGHEAVAVYGALGSRLDHTVATFQALTHAAKCGMRVVAVGEGSLVVALSAGARNALELPADASGTLSVFAATDCARGVCERGLLYEVEDACFTNDSTLGLSNEFKGAAATISLEEGVLLVFLPLMPLRSLCWRSGASEAASTVEVAGLSGRA